MRYIGLVFLGLVLWTGQASAGMVLGKAAEQIVIKGEIIHKIFREKRQWCEMRVIHEGNYYRCIDFYEAMGDNAILKCQGVD